MYSAPGYFLPVPVVLKNFMKFYIGTVCERVYAHERSEMKTNGRSSSRMKILGYAAPGFSKDFSCCGKEMKHYKFSSSSNVYDESFGKGCWPEFEIMCII